MTFKMELNSSFVGGLACGVCIGLSLLVFKRFSRVSASSALKSNGNGSKSENLLGIDIIKRAVQSGGEYKLVLVVRNDLKMGKGKIGAQCAHAAVGAYSKALKKDKQSLTIWEYTGQAKIAVKVDSEEELMEIYQNAKKAGLVTSLIRDAGRTQIAPNTKTVLGIGPASKSAIDEITGHLKLLS